MSFSGFEPTLFRFLKQLKRNNNRDWLGNNKDRYENEVRGPSLEFIRAFETPLKKISPFFVASDRKVGGSLMRVYRDTRFSRDKTPLKTNVGIQFRHEMGKDVHAPGFYIHIAPGECFWGVGVWHPDAETLKKIRLTILEESAKWKRTRDGKKFRTHFELAGDSLKSPPRGYPKDHPFLEDLKRKDFCGIRQIQDAEVLANDFLENTVKAFVATRPFVRFLCEALRLPF